ncbi:hypothetical protein EVJ58_g2038 [Rhodofomes roseus]|uniref:Uncharacterized protein n=1 Tax=Rhodofomes roseus TaxID=34475 RepID=A0A4Y9YW00_9APHY|nr:hypothetical protein EVJ58_g2038 [Rhodofomes roseus]
MEDDIEVELGDVGYLDKGGFCRMFNAMREKDDPLNNKPDNVPDDFEKFTIDMKPRRTNTAIDAGPLLSRTVKRVGAKTEAVVHGARAGFEFECIDNQGACVVVGSSAARLEIHSARRMKGYMKKNIDSWVHYATETLGMEKKLDEILFVKGWVKTTHWAVAAFVDRAKNAKVSVSGGIGAMAEVGVGLLVESSSSSVDHHTGPGTRMVQVPQISPKRNNKKSKNREQPEIVPKAELKANQCVFLHYFKMKRRLVLPPKIEAAAEPQDGSTFSDDDDYEFEEAPMKRKSYDPVDYVLDYILENSDATEAIASDSDILELCKTDDEYPIPDDIPAFLDSLRPEIELTSDGLGMLHFDDAITIQRIAESAALAQQSAQNPSTSEERPPEDQTESSSRADSDPTQSPPGDSTGASNPDPTRDTNSGGGTNAGGDHRDPPRAEEGEEKKFGLSFETSDSLLQMPHDVDAERKGGVFALAYSAPGNKVAAGFEDATVIVWSGDNRRILHTLEGHKGSICSLAFSPDGQRLVTGSRDHFVAVWDVVTGDRLRVLRGHEGFVNCVAYSPDGRLIASASVDSTVKLWDAETGMERATTEGHDAMVMSVAFSPDSRRMISASAEGIAYLWDTIDAQRTSTLSGHEGVIYTTTFSPAGDRLITSSDDGSSKVWGAEFGELYMTLREHRGSVWAAVFSADGRHILSAASDRTVKICDSYSAEVLDTIDGGDDLANAATFSPDGKYIAAGGEDHTISVWSMETKQRTRQFSGHRDNINKVVFSPDNKRLVTASDDGSVRLWRLDGPQYIPAVAL